MRFLRRGQIYRSDGPFQVKRGEGLRPWGFLVGARSELASPPTHRLDESAVGYSSAGCSPAEPASASPTALIVQ